MLLGRHSKCVKTVEYHLRNVFAKLGIASRTELIRLELGEQAGAQQPA